MRKSFSNSYLETGFFGLCVVLFIVVRIGFFAPAILERAAPVEPDDAYGYIVKAAQLESCFLQDCPALTDLRQQLAVPVSDAAATRLAYRQYHRLLYVFHPLHSVILAGVRGLGMTWEQAYKAVQLAGIPLVALAAAAFLHAVWGPGAAGMALLLVAVTLFRGHGLHTIVPSNLAFAVAMALWAAMAMGRRHPALVVGAIAVMLAMHPLGRVYGVVSLVFLALWSPRPWGPREWGTVGSGLAMVVVASYLGLIISQPALSMEPYAGWTAGKQSIVSAVAGNLGVAYEVVQAWISGFGGRLEAALLVAVGFVLVPRQRWRLVLSVTAVTCLLAAAGLAHGLPDYPGAAFVRLWIPLALVLYGAVGLVAWRLLTEAASWVRRSGEGKQPAAATEETLLSPRGWTIAASLVLALLLLQSFAGMSVNGLELLRKLTRSAAASDNIHLDSGQPGRFLDISAPGDAVLYRDETTMPFYLSNGALARGAVYFHAVHRTDLEDRWLVANPDLRFVVGGNPVREGRLTVGPGATLDIERPAGLSLRNLALRIHNPNPAEAVLMARPSTDATHAEHAFELRIAATTNGWVDLPAAPEGTATRLQISLEGAGVIHLDGLRVSPTAELNWPWDEGVTVTLNDPGATGKPKAVEFVSGDLDPSRRWPVQVIDDSGASVLGRLLR